VDYITKEDLIAHTTDIKEHINLKLDPIRGDVDTLKKTVFGKTGANGMARTVNILQWGYGLFALGIGVLIHKVFIL